MEQIVHSAWSMIPFGLMLLVIAVAPLIVAEWWDKNKHKLAVSLLLAIPTAVCLVMGGMAKELEHQLLADYVPFLVLLMALYVITGGIHLSGDIKAKPWINTSFLARVGSLFLLQVNFPNQKSNWGLLHCRRIIYQLTCQGSPDKAIPIRKYA